MKQIIKIGGITCFLFLFGCLSVHAQKFRSEAYRSYIEKHAMEAIRQMNKYRIPASITMAQALVESAAGTSNLSKDFNNHFGIKCHNGWQGGRTYHDDDLKHECFRTYNNWRQSYEDHSRFLLQKRYRYLFTLNPHDYISWARGLQSCGYATNRGYANMLISIIETDNLYALDDGNMPNWVNNQGRISEVWLKQRNNNDNGPHRATYISYGLLYVIAKQGDSYKKIAQDMGMDAKDIASWNDAPLNFPLKKGDIVYLQEKNDRATEKYPIYEVKVGDSMHSISQKFGIKMDKLYDFNYKNGDYVPTEGDILRLR